MNEETEIGSIEDFNNHVTIFYSLYNGEIKATCGGRQDMDYFGESKNDYNYGFIVIEYDDFIMSNLQLFKVEDGQLKMKNLLSKYI